MKGISVYILSEESRARLAEEFPPRFSTFVGHHVTVKFGASDKDPLPPAGVYKVVGHTAIIERKIGGSGIEALVVTVDGSKEREDGEVYHITWSHGPGYAPKDSKELVKKGHRVITPIEINMEPTFIPFNK
jgi:hypothetical protein